MASYSVTLANWNSPAFWAGISQTSAGHTLDFGALPSSFTVDFDAVSGIATISDGTTTFTVGEPGASGTDATLGGTTDWSFLNTVFATQGNDTLSPWTGNHTLDGGAGDDLFNIGFGMDTIVGGDGVDTLSIAVADDAINIVFNASGAGTFSDADGDGGAFSQIEAFVGSAGSDTIDGARDSAGVALDGAAGADTITGGAGDDTIIGGSGNDLLTGGGGDDVFTYAVGDGLDTVTDFNAGNSGALGDADPTNNDVLDVSGFYDDIEELRRDYDDDGTLNQSNSTATGGDVDYSNNSQFSSGDGIVFQNITRNGLTTDNTGVVCFTKGTKIATAQGEVAVEDLRPGQMVQTMDNGYQRLRWIGKRLLEAEELWLNPKLRPIRVSKAAFGLRDVGDDLIVSPQHRVLLSSKVADKMFGSREVLIPAIKLLGMAETARIEPVPAVLYFHLLFDHHEIVFANCVPAESLYLGDEALRTLGAEGRAEIHTLFPETVAKGFAAGQCRPFAQGKRATQIAHRLSKNTKHLMAQGA